MQVQVKALIKGTVKQIQNDAHRRWSGDGQTAIPGQKPK